MTNEIIIEALRYYARRCDGVHACWHDKTLKDAAAAIETLVAEVARLQTALDAASARADKAVGDLNVMALAMRESEELSEGCCFACICDGQNLPDNAILPYGECPGYERDDCFKWRGDAAEENS